MSIGEQSVRASNAPSPAANESNRSACAASAILIERAESEPRWAAAVTMRIKEHALSRELGMRLNTLDLREMALHVIAQKL